jgi:hypothetical protein
MTTNRIVTTTSPPAPEGVIPVNHKFSALAFDDCMEVKLSTAAEVAPNLRAYPAAPFELPQHWKEWIGTLKNGHFTEANLVLIITRASAAPSVLDQETRDLERELTAFVFGLMLGGVPDYKETTWFSGANVDGALSVRGLRSLDTFYRTPGQARPVLDDASLSNAAAIGAETLKVFASPDHYRVRVGFGKLVDGLKSRNPRVRLHEFVRAIDGLMALEVGQSTKQFVHRGRTFASFANADGNCKPFYDLRSAEEHLNEWTPILDPAARLARQERDALALAWTDAAQRLARDVYRRLLTSPKLLAEFKDENSTRAFWKLDDAERRKRWGTPYAITVDPKPFQKALSSLA